jgi:hypothetical protein
MWMVCPVSRPRGGARSLIKKTRSGLRGSRRYRFRADGNPPHRGIGIALLRTVETFGHDDFRNVLYTCDKTDQRLMIARLSLQISWPSQRVWMSR